MIKQDRFFYPLTLTLVPQTHLQVPIWRGCTHVTHSLVIIIISSPVHVANTHWLSWEHSCPGNSTPKPWSFSIFFNHLLKSIKQVGRGTPLSTWSYVGVAVKMMWEVPVNDTYLFYSRQFCTKLGQVWFLLGLDVLPKLWEYLTCCHVNQHCREFNYKYDYIKTLPWQQRTIFNPLTTH